MVKKPSSRPRTRKTEFAIDRIEGRALVAKPSDDRQLELFDAPFPNWIEPCKPVLVKSPPRGPEWQHEIKWDGYRISIYLENGVATIKSSHGNDFTIRFRATHPFFGGGPGSVQARGLCDTNFSEVFIAGGAEGTQSFSQAFQSRHLGLCQRIRLA